jgi:non-ribosomal peptide synthase protein (TIGR01720 family)
LPVDLSAGANVNSSIEDIRNSLTPAETRELLQETPKHYRAQINEVLLAALAQTLAVWSGSPDVLMELEGHGREDIAANIDLTRTVGWFTSRFPVLLRVDASRPEVLVKSVKEQFRAIPNRGFGYGVLRYLGDRETSEQLRRLPQPQITFNYLGQFDQMSTSLFHLANGPKGPEHSPQQARRHLLELTAVVLDNALQLKWSFSRNRHRRETIEGLAANFLAGLRDIISQKEATAELSQTDFPHASLSQGDLDKIIDRIRR